MTVWLAALLAGCGPKAPPPVVFTSSDDVTEDRLDALVAELVPLVEEVAGRRFTTVPPCRLGRRVDLQRIVEEEFRSVVVRLSPDVPEWVVDVQAHDAGLGVSGIVGKYGVFSRVLYLAPDAVMPITAAAGLAPERAVDVARVVLAHELTHALQDQVAGLDAAWGTLPDAEAFDALRGLTEGHANFVEHGVAERLGLLPVVAALDAGQGWTEEDGPLTADAYELWALYGQGRKWVTHLSAGDPDAVWDLLAHPPRTTTPMFRWDAAAPDVVLDPAPLDGIERDLTDEPWIASVRALGEMALRQDGWSLDHARFDAVLAHVTGAVAREAYRSDRRATMWRIAVDDPQVARDWLALWQDVAPDGRVQVDAVPVAAGDAALRVTVGPPEPRSASQEVDATWIVVGSELYVVRADGFRPGVRMDAAVRDLLGRL